LVVVAVAAEAVDEADSAEVVAEAVAEAVAEVVAEAVDAESISILSFCRHKKESLKSQENATCTYVVA
jgi:capsular polysaccharide biosynthesis protein